MSKLQIQTKMRWIRCHNMGPQCSRVQIIMKARIYHVALLCVTAVSLLCPPSNHASVELQGTVKYEGYNRGKIGFTTTEAFSVIYDDGRCKYRTVCVETQPHFKKSQLFCPMCQEVGTDGVDFYYKKTMNNIVSTNTIGWVQPGEVPLSEQGTAIMFLWMAFGSGHFLVDKNTMEMVSPWSRTKVGNDPSVYFTNKILYSSSKENPAFLSNLCMLSEKEIGLLSQPISMVFTQTLFKTTEFIKMDVGYVPAKFALEHFEPVFSSNRTDNLRLSIRITGEITNSHPIQTPSTWFPALTGDKLYIRDKRFLDSITNWSSVTYTITNAWFPRDHPALQRILKYHRMNSPMRVMSPPNKN
jgi:hypothetical protein